MPRPSSQSLSSETRLKKLSAWLFPFCVGTLGAWGFSDWHAWPLWLGSLTWLFLWPFIRNKPFTAPHFFCWKWGLLTTAFYWTSLSLGVEIERFWFLVPISALILPALVAGFHTAVLFVCLRLFRIQNMADNRFPFVFLAVYSGLEFLRSTCFFGGLPWNLVADAFINVPLIRGSAYTWGAQGVSFFVLALNLIPSFIWIHKKNARALLLLAGLCTVCLGALGIGVWLQPARQNTLHPHFHMRLVQPNTPVSRHAAGPKAVDHLIKLSHHPGHQNIALFIWPEATLPAYLVREAVAKLKLKPRQYLITGVIRRDDNGNPCNSMVLLNRHGHVLELYDKRHLAPFGEYIPGRTWLAKILPPHKLRTLTFGMRDFAAGTATIGWKEAKPIPALCPLICFDSAFATDIMPADMRPQWLLELTNNGWFGKSWGLTQHLTQGRWRATENNLPLVRCTLSGITALITSDGEVLSELPSHTTGVFDTCLPTTSTSPSFFQHAGHWPFFVLWLSLIIGLLVTTLLDSHERNKGTKRKKEKNAPKKHATKKTTQKARTS